MRRARGRPPARSAAPGCGGSRTDPGDDRRGRRRTPDDAVRRKPATVPVTLVAHPAAGLSAGIQDAAAAPQARRPSCSEGSRPPTPRGLTWCSSRAAGAVPRHLPLALHDAAAASSGEPSTSSAAATGSPSTTRSCASTPAAPAITVARLPAPSSDQSAAAIGGTAYVVGGYTGTRWLDTIVAWRPGLAARVSSRTCRRRFATRPSPPPTATSSSRAARSPTARRATAVSRSTRRRPGPPDRHAARADHARRGRSARGRVYVDRRPRRAVDTPTARIVAVDPRPARVRPAGRLRAAALGPGGGRGRQADPRRRRPRRAPARP